MKWTDRAEYEKRLKRKQAAHLKKVRSLSMDKVEFIPCLHDECEQCHGTGLRLDGTACIHNLSCPCPKCTPSMTSNHLVQTPNGYRKIGSLKQNDVILSANGPVKVSSVYQYAKSVKVSGQ